MQRKCSANVVHRCRASAAKVEHECSASAVQVQPRLMFCATPTQILHGRMRYDPAWTVPEVGLIPNHLRGVDSALPRGSHGRPRTTWRCLRVQAATRRPEPTPCHMTTACGSCAVQVRRKCSARAASVQRKCSAGRRSRLQLGLSQEVHVWPEREVLGLASWAAHVEGSSLGTEPPPGQQPSTCARMCSRRVRRTGPLFLARCTSSATPCASPSLVAG